jgi:hypothetical protein
MSNLAPDYKVPSRNTVKSRIEMIYCDRKEEFSHSGHFLPTLFIFLALACTTVETFPSRLNSATADFSLFAGFSPVV